MSPIQTFQCPTCKQHSSLASDNPWRPFCSERCRLIDLGDWASEAHRIAGEPAAPSDTQLDEDGFNQKW